MGYILRIQQVPTQLSRLHKGINHAKVGITPKDVEGCAVVPLLATFAFAVHAGGQFVCCHCFVVLVYMCFCLRYMVGCVCVFALSIYWFLCCIVSDLTQSTTT